MPGRKACQPEVRQNGVLAIYSDDAASDYKERPSRSGSQLSPRNYFDRLISGRWAIWRGIAHGDVNPAVPQQAHVSG